MPKAEDAAEIVAGAVTSGVGARAPADEDGAPPAAAAEAAAPASSRFLSLGLREPFATASLSCFFFSRFFSPPTPFDSEVSGSAAFLFLGSFFFFGRASLDVDITDMRTA